MTISPGTLAGASGRHPWRTIAVWGLALVGAFLLAITLVPDALDGEDGPIQTLESERADQLAPPRPPPPPPPGPRSPPADRPRRRVPAPRPRRPVARPVGCGTFSPALAAVATASLPPRRPSSPRAREGETNDHLG